MSTSPLEHAGMDRRPRPFALLVLLLALSVPAVTAPPAAGEPAAVDAAFDKDCEAAVLAAAAGAEREILAAVYSLTNPRIVDALGAAAARGVRVQVKYDARQADYEGMAKALKELRRRRVKCQAVKIDPDYAAMHHKFMVVDRRRVLTGSFNYTSAAATANEENLVVIDSEPLAARFAAEFESIRSR